MRWYAVIVGSLVLQVRPVSVRADARSEPARRAGSGEVVLFEGAGGSPLGCDDGWPFDDQVRRTRYIGVAVDGRADVASGVAMQVSLGAADVRLATLTSETECDDVVIAPRAAERYLVFGATIAIGPEWTAVGFRVGLTLLEDGDQLMPWPALELRLGPAWPVHLHIELLSRALTHRGLLAFEVATSLLEDRLRMAAGLRVGAITLLGADVTLSAFPAGPLIRLAAGVRPTDPTMHHAEIGVGYVW